MTAVDRRYAATDSIPLSVSGSVSSGSALQPLNSSMIAVAIVAIAVDFGPSDAIPWVISSLYIATAVTGPMAGKLGALFGARRVYLTGSALVAVSAVMGSLAPSIGWLIASYALLGVGTASHLPNAMIMVRSYAEHFDLSPRSGITVLALCSQSVAALGPTLGGLLVGTFGWQSILWINIPVAVLSTIAVLRFTDREIVGPASSSNPRGPLASLDLVGVLLFLVLICATMFFLLSVGDRPVWWLPALWASVLVLFVWRELRALEPFIDVRTLVRNRPLTATLGRTLLTYTAFYCIFFGIPQWLQSARGMNAVEAGLTMLPVAGVGLCATMLGSRTFHRFGARVTLAIGTSALLIGGVLLATVESSAAPVVVLLIVAGVLGIPNGFNNIGNQNILNSVTTVAEVGTAIGMYRTVQYVGANLSTVVLQMTTGGVLDDDGLHRTGWVIAAISGLLLGGVVISRNLISTGRRSV